MNYELAQELKDAGFPQVWPRPDFMEIKDALIIDEMRKKYPDQFDPYRPDLEELIEACGRHLCVMRVSRKEKFIAVARKYNGKKGGEFVSDISMKDSVSKLWLAVHKK